MKHRVKHYIYITVAGIHYKLANRCQVQTVFETIEGKPVDIKFRPPMIPPSGKVLRFSTLLLKHPSKIVPSEREECNESQNMSLLPEQVLSAVAINVNSVDRK